MDTYQKITEARKTLQIPEQATLAEIKKNYRKLMLKYHPDRYTRNIKKDTDVAAQITSAYKIIMTYCTQYKFSFTSEEIKKYLPPDEWWLERFGHDPHWGKEREE